MILLIHALKLILSWIRLQTSDLYVTANVWASFHSFGFSTLLSAALSSWCQYGLLQLEVSGLFELEVVPEQSFFIAKMNLPNPFQNPFITQSSITSYGKEPHNLITHCMKRY